MKILITGTGGREHGLAWRAAQSPWVTEVFLAPGNAGTSNDGKLSNVDIDVMDFDAQIVFAKKHDIDLTIIGPEAPLVAGAVDRFKQAGLRCFGPTANSAQLEGSKSFTKDFLARHHIPTADYGSFDDFDTAVDYARTMYARTDGAPMVIKADGLAAGKGVIIAKDLVQAEETIHDMMQSKSFGRAGDRIVIEEFLEGEEASFIVISDGKTAIPFASSQDHKAAYNGDFGPNTGGMGAYSPAPVVTASVHEKIMTGVINPTISGMAEDGHEYIGFLYAGLMIDGEGNPKVIEFNCRFGDPETQPVMMRMQSDLVQLCNDAIDGNLLGKKISFDGQTALTVVMAAGGYPLDYDKGDEITGIPAENEMSKTFHAGTRLIDGKCVTSGGRVLGITALGNSVQEAQTRAYEIVQQISFRKSQYRTDIGYRAITREQRG